jgi:copper chaperone CopZ
MKTLFAVPMTCESCIKDISGSLFKLSGIQKVEANLKDQLVTIEGTGSSHHFMHVTRLALNQALTVQF